MRDGSVHAMGWASWRLLVAFESCNGATVASAEGILRYCEGQRQRERERFLLWWAGGVGGKVVMVVVVKLSTEDTLHDDK